MLDKGYGWCDIDANLQILLDWFDYDKSWAAVRWFDSIIWSRRINEGQQYIFTSQQIIFLIVSLLANIKILTYHFTSPNHPKFAVTPFSRWCIRTHVLSGSIGVILPLYVFFTTEHQLATALMFVFVAWDFVFAISAVFQTPNVYGVRVLTIPLYYACVVIKFILNVCLLQSLLYEPLGGYKTKVEWLWICWTVHQTYAWVRIWYYFFYSMDAVLDHQYTVSVFLAGTLCGGAAVGLHLWIVWMALTFSYHVYLTIISWSMTKELATIGDGKEDQARAEEIRRRAATLAIMWSEAQPNSYRGDPTAEQIALQFCLEHSIDYTAPDVCTKTPKSVKALMLFKAINRNGSGKISAKELENYLIGFGVMDITKYSMKLLKKSDKDRDGKIELEDFEKYFEPFYQYAFDGMIFLVKKSNDPSTTRNTFETIVQKLGGDEPPQLSRGRSFNLKSRGISSASSFPSFGSEGCPFAAAWRSGGGVGKDDDFGVDVVAPDCF